MKHNRTKADFGVVIKSSGKGTTCCISYRGEFVYAFGTSSPSRDSGSLMKSAEITINSNIHGVNGVCTARADKIDEALAS